jgi:hypothetical protein
VNLEGCWAYSECHSGSFLCVFCFINTGEDIVVISF